MIINDNKSTIENPTRYYIFLILCYSRILSLAINSTSKNRSNFAAAKKVHWQEGRKKVEQMLTKKSSKQTVVCEKIRKQ